MSDSFETLTSLAKDASFKAYAPYSQFQVGAALETGNGELFTGCNVENASYGLAICAERNAITTAVTNGISPGDVKRLVIFIDKEELFSPCGACRQFMSEFMPADAEIRAVNKLGEAKNWTMSQLLPDGFTLD